MDVKVHGMFRCNCNLTMPISPLFFPFSCKPAAPDLGLHRSNLQSCMVAITNHSSANRNSETVSPCRFGAQTIGTLGAAFLTSFSRLPEGDSHNAVAGPPNRTSCCVKQIPLIALQKVRPKCHGCPGFPHYRDATECHRFEEFILVISLVPECFFQHRSYDDHRLGHQGSHALL